MQSEHAGTGTVRSGYGFASGCVALSFLLQSSQIFSPNEIEGAFSHIYFETGLRFFFLLHNYT